MKEDRYRNISVFALFILFLFSHVSLESASLRDVVVNEIAWMGTGASANDEWIELYNTTGSALDLSGWTLSAADGSPSILLGGSISPGGYFLLERTDDTTISDIASDLIFSGSIGNTGEFLSLRNATGNLIDEVNCADGWFGGTSTPRASMERLHPSIDGSSASSWTTNDGSTMNGLDAGGSPILGTPRAKNSGFDASLSVMLSEFSANYDSEGVIICWKTESEVESQGFHIMRSENQNGPYRRITPDLIPGRGNSSTGMSYEYRDEDVLVNREYWYQIHEINTRGEIQVLAMMKVITEETGTVPEEFRLFNNYPNPFNPSTTIHYSVNYTPRIRILLQIYDMLGKKVATLVDRVDLPGNYFVDWDGCDNCGDEVPSGPYFCRLFAEKRVVDTKRMIKLR